MRVRFSKKGTFKDLLFVTGNDDGRHTDNGILEVLQLEMHGWFHLQNTPLGR